MPSPMVDADEDAGTLAVRWLQVLKLLLSVILMAIAVWRALLYGSPV